MADHKKKSNRKLLVEGNDDQHVVWALCKKFELSENFDVIDCKGIDELLKDFPVRLKGSDIQTVGIIADADTNFVSRWQSVSKILEKAGYVVPTELSPEGLILQSINKVKVGLWIMPDNKSGGMLEDFIRFLIPDTDLLLREAKASLENIESQNLQKYIPFHQSKALIHTWLAWQENPGTPMGLAITKTYLPVDQQVCLKFIGWLRQLFED